MFSLTLMPASLRSCWISWAYWGTSNTCQVRSSMSRLLLPASASSAFAFSMSCLRWGTDLSVDG